jgi:hypothetical protein
VGFWPFNPVDVFLRVSEGGQDPVKLRSSRKRGAPAPMKFPKQEAVWPIDLRVE